MPDDKARIEALEADVEVLKEAVRSVAAWSVRTAPLRQRDSPVGVIVQGQDETQEILKRLS